MDTIYFVFGKNRTNSNDSTNGRKLEGDLGKVKLEIMPIAGSYFLYIYIHTKLDKECVNLRNSSAYSICGSTELGKCMTDCTLGCQSVQCMTTVPDSSPPQTNVQYLYIS